MKRSTMSAVALAFVSTWVVMVAAFGAVWLTQEVRVIGLVTLPAGIVAGLLVVYFDWRAKLRGTPTKAEERLEFDKAA